MKYLNQENKNFLFYLQDGQYNSISWNEVNNKIKSLSNFFHEKGILKGDRILLASENRPEWLISDLAVTNLGAITVPNYTTYTVKDFSYVIKDCSPKALIVSNDEILEKILLAAKNNNFKFEFIIKFNDNFTEGIFNFNKIKESNFEKNKKVLRSDPACIIYTSGTQGNPKGVILSHGGIISNCEGAIEIIKEIKTKQFKFLTWLPLSHSYEHTIQFVQMAVGAEIYYSPKIEQLLENIKLAKPDIMTAVPRFYNNLYNKMFVGATKANFFKKWLFFQTVKIGTKIFLKQKINILERVNNLLLELLVRKKYLKILVAI